MEATNKNVEPFLLALPMPEKPATIKITATKLVIAKNVQVNDNNLAWFPPKAAVPIVAIQTFPKKETNKTTHDPIRTIDLEFLSEPTNAITCKQIGTKIDTYNNVSEIPKASPPVARVAKIIASISKNIAIAGKINNFLMFIKGSPFVVILF